MSDPQLRKRLRAIDIQIKKLRGAEEKYLLLEASRKSHYALIYMQTKGTVAERENMAYASEEWRNFATGLAHAEVDYNMEKRNLELQFKAYDAEHLTYKNEANAIPRQGAIT